MQSLSQDLDSIDETDLFLAFKAFVLAVARAQRARLFSQADPAGKKIHRNLKGQILRSAQFELTVDYRNDVLRVKRAKSADRLPAYPTALFEQEFSSRVSGPMNTTEILQIVYTVLKGQDEYRKSIPLFDLVNIVRRFYSGAATEPADDRQEYSLDSLEDQDLTYIKQETIHAVNEKIVSTYVLKKKVSKEDGECLSRVLQSIVDDWFGSQMTGNSFYDHVIAFRPMTQDEYDRVWRKKVEYLTRIARTSIAGYLEADL